MDLLAKERFCQMLSLIHQRKVETEIFRMEEFIVLEELIKGQGVYGIFASYGDSLPEQMKQRANSELIKNAQGLYKMLYYSRYFINELKKNGIFAVVIKGCDLAGYYQKPECRSFGDMDLLLCDSRQIEKANDIMCSLGCTRCERQDSRHHIEYSFKGQMIIELHCFVVRAFDKQQMNQKMNEIFCLKEEDVIIHSVLGYELPVMRDAKNACYILLHMLQHFLNAGFGIRLLLDWVVFWDREIAESEISEYIQTIKELKIEGFSQTITAASVKYLGLTLDRVEKLLPDSNKEYDKIIDELVEDILSAGRFGESNNSRVVAPKNVRISGLLLEFHHQMKENYPFLSKIFVLWPILWILTGIRFVINNRRVRKVKIKDVLKTSIKRGKLAEKMGLWH